jgi:hypothetical protein
MGSTTVQFSFYTLAVPSVPVIAALGILLGALAGFVAPVPPPSTAAPAAGGPRDATEAAHVDAGAPRRAVTP